MPVHRYGRGGPGPLPPLNLGSQQSFPSLAFLSDVVDSQQRLRLRLGPFSEALV